MDQAATDPRWWHWSRLRQIEHRIMDPLLAVALVGLGVASLALSSVDPQHPNPPDLLAYVLLVVGLGALAVRSRAPMTALAVCFGATAWSSILEYPESGLPIGCMIGLYTVAALRPRERSLVAAGAVTALILVLTALGSQGLNLASAVANLGIFGVVYAVGRYVRVRRAYTEQLELRAADHERARQRDAEQAVAQERLRIARELHDVVAHAMSIVAVQSGVAAHVIDQRPDEARTMLASINTVSCQALAEMRRMLGVLRSEGDEAPGELTPAPSLGDLDSLVRSMEGTGVTVRLTVDGDRRDLAPGLDLAAFRIVQEALTNVVRHAGPSCAEVRVAYGPGELTVSVVDDGRGAASLASPGGGGHGLVGMRERVELYGGALTAGPHPGGGFAVSATLPYDAAVIVA